MLLPPDRGTLHGTSEEVEDGTDGTYMTMDVQLIPMKYVHFSCLGAVMPIQSRSGLAALMASMIALLSSSENSGLYGGE